MIKAKLKLTGVFEPGEQALFKRCFIAALKETAAHWQNHILPGHFLPNAFAKYKYEKRSEKYQKRKDRLGLGPMEWSGREQDKILGDKRQATARGFGKVKLRIPCAGFFNWQYNRKKGKRWPYTMADELTQITPEENRRLKQVFMETLIQLFNQAEGSRKMLKREAGGLPRTG